MTRKKKTCKVRCLKCGAVYLADRVKSRVTITPRCFLIDKTQLHPDVCGGRLVIVEKYKET